VRALAGAAEGASALASAAAPRSAAAAAVAAAAASKTADGLILATSIALGAISLDIALPGSGLVTRVAHTGDLRVGHSLRIGPGAAAPPSAATPLALAVALAAEEDEAHGASPEGAATATAAAEDVRVALSGVHVIVSPPLLVAGIYAARRVGAYLSGDAARSALAARAGAAGITAGGVGGAGARSRASGAIAAARAPALSSGVDVLALLSGGTKTRPRRGGVFVRNATDLPLELAQEIGGALARGADGLGAGGAPAGGAGAGSAAATTTAEDGALAMPGTETFVPFLRAGAARSLAPGLALRCITARATSGAGPSAGEAASGAAAPWRGSWARPVPLDEFFRIAPAAEG
jgi:hypothetical protein